MAGEYEHKPGIPERSDIEEVPTVEWKDYKDGQSRGVILRYPHGFMHGTLYNQEDQTVHAFIEIMNVEDEFHKKGIGTKLLKSFTAEMKNEGATSIGGLAITDTALKLLRRVFGEENLYLYIKRNEEIQNFTYEEALIPEPNVNFLVDLEEIDTTDWDLPKRINN